LLKSKKGLICREHGCSSCCEENSMPLTVRDIRKIIKNGYKSADFIVMSRGERHLRNSEGKCVFLEGGQCNIYSFRPEGCRLYPLLYDPSNDSIVIDPACPHRGEFKINQTSAEKLRKLVKTVKREKRRELIY